MASFPLKLLYEREAELGRRISEARQALNQLKQIYNPYAKYRKDPVGYIEKVLGQKLWAKQIEVAESLVKPPYKTLVKASHSIGKTMLAGSLVNWSYDVYNPGVTLTTAPVFKQVRDQLWKEVRKQRKHKLEFAGPKNPRLESAPDHFAHGFTADDPTSFQGQHEASVFIIFDEAVGIEPGFWEAAESMCQGVNYHWLGIFNPTDTSSQAYLECIEAEGRWNVIEIPAIDHPNIAAELRGEDPPFPAAVRLQWFREHLDKWAEKIYPEDRKPGDIEFPKNNDAIFDQVKGWINKHSEPVKTEWWRLGPLAESRLFARWPSVGTGVWSEYLLNCAETCMEEFNQIDIPEIGCDVARYGDDFTGFHVRCGPQSIYHEERNGWSTDQTAARLQALCREYAKWKDEKMPKNSAAIDPKQILVKIDDDGLGGGVVDQSNGYNFHGVGAGTKAFDSESYPRRRDELWFMQADRARTGRWAINGKYFTLTKEQKREIKRQAIAVKWKVDWSGRRQVEQKEKTKEKIKRSPDTMDSINLAFAPVSGTGVASWVGGESEY